jgi:hypothetical protein
MNGNPFPEPFVFPLATSPDWEMNKIVTYEITLSRDGVAVETEVSDWSENDVSILYDKQWWLSVDKDDLELKFDGGDLAEFTAETNYDTSVQGFPAGLQITGAEIEYLPEEGVTGATADNDWITLGLSNSPNSTSQTVTVTASKNEKFVERKAKIKVKAGNLTKIIDVTQEPALPVVKPEDEVDNSLYLPYVGAFWKKNQTGERVITIPISAENAGYWSAQVYYSSGFKQGDIRFSTTPSSDPDFGTDATADMNSSANDASYSVLNGKKYVTGKVADNGGVIFFRIGLESSWSGTTDKPARYAVVVIGYKDNTKLQTLYLRQGEDPDYLIHPEDGGYGNRATYAKKFSPYNLTAPNMGDSDHINVNTGVFVDYPSQAGAFFKWVVPGSTGQGAWHPAKPTVSGYGNSSSSLGAWSTTYETCPSGYCRPTTDDKTTSEFAASLLSNPSSDPEVGNDGNSVFGYYADGFFDRRAIVTPNGELYMPNTAVNKDSYNAAYIGRLFFNDISGSQKRGASIFFPAPGSRKPENGDLVDAGVYGFYWTLSIAAANLPTHARSMNLSKDSVGYHMENLQRARAISIRCVVK